VYLRFQEVDRIIFCLFLPVDVDLYKSMMPLFFPSPAPTADDQSEQAVLSSAANGNEVQADSESAEISPPADQMAENVSADVEQSSESLKQVDDSPIEVGSGEVEAETSASIPEANIEGSPSSIA
jgi:hypothetical protein